MDLEREYEGGVLLEALNDFLERLDREDRFVFMRRYWYGDEIKTIAYGCGFSESNVKSKLFRCRQKLKQDLEGKGLI